jgi:serine-type anaerobic sulfatase-maturating enzyme
MSRDITPTVSRLSAPPMFHMLSKPTGAACNLDCKYCFFLSKDALYPDERLRMSDEVLESYIKQLLESHQTPTVIVAWQGGEPTLMGVDFFRRSVDFVHKYRRPGQQVEYTFQTNGVLIDDEWAAFFKEHDVLIGLSVDGPRDVHDAYRVTKGGQGTFDQVMRGLSFLRAHDVRFNILCTVNAANGDHGRDVYRFFRDELHAEWMQFIPIIERATPETLPIANLGWSSRPGGQRVLYTQTGSLVTDRSVKPEQYGRFLIDIFEEWVRKDVGRVYVQLFDVTLEACFGSYRLCIHAPTCGYGPAIEHNGDVYACDHYVEPDYRLGNIGETHMLDMIASPKQRKFGLDKQATLTKQCRDCEVRHLCNGGCPKDRFVNSRDGEPGHNYLCAGLKAFFDHVDPAMKTMVSLLKNNRAPADIMKIYAEGANGRT